MALTQNVRIARDKFGAQAGQAGLLASIQQTHALRAELHKARAKQAVLEAQLGRQKAVHGQEVAHAKYMWEGQELEQKKIIVLLQSFNVLTRIYNNIHFTCALIMGQIASSFIKTHMYYASMHVRFVLWGTCLLFLNCFIHALFTSALAITDGTKLAFQGTRGIQDVSRAFHGLVKLRSEIFWHYVVGFIGFAVVLNMTIWAKIAEERAQAIGVTPATGLNFSMEDWLYCGLLTGVAWLLFVLRLALCFRTTRRIFRMNYDTGGGGDDMVDGAAAAVHRLDLADDFSVSLGPQSLRQYQQHRRRSSLPLSAARSTAPVSPTAGSSVRHGPPWSTSSPPSRPRSY